jgi:hypothetical protein
MIVSRVSHTNIDEIYEAILIAQNNPTYTKDMGENLIVMLKNASITMDIKDASIFEAYMLKMFSNDQNLWVSNRRVDVNGCGEKNAVIFRSIDQLAKSMLNDTDIKIKPAGVLFNTGNIKTDLTITFSGVTLFNIISTLPDQFFKRYNIQQAKAAGKGDITVDNALSVTDVDLGEAFSNYIVNEFANHFWDFFKKSVSVIDVCSDSFINSNYYAFTSDSNRDVVLANVDTPYGSTSFIRDDENLQESIDKCKAVFNTIPDDKRALQYKMINLSFVINCDFYTFLEMFLALPSYYFINKQDLKLIFAKNVITFDHIYSTYKTRIATKLDDAMKVKKEASSDIENTLIRYNSIPLLSSYKFTLKLNLNEIRNELLRYETYIREGAYSDNCNDYLSYSILNIIDKIKAQSLQVFKILTK